MEYAKDGVYGRAEARECGYARNEYRNNDGKGHDDKNQVLMSRSFDSDYVKKTPGGPA